jgi:hypothetical protein
MKPHNSEFFTGAYLWLLPHDVIGFKCHKAEIENILRRLIAGIWLSTAQVAII